MSNGKKILIGIIVIINLSVCIYVGVTINRTINSSSNEIQSNKTHMDNYIDGIIENNQTEDNISTENAVTETETNTSKEPEIIGKEEEESSKENTGLTDQETAIKMAQEEWGIDVDSYIFETNLNSDGTYKVTVRNKTDRNAVTQYTVNVKAKTIVEE